MAKAKKPKAPASASKSIEGAIQITHSEHDYGADASVESTKAVQRASSPSTSIAHLPTNRTENEVLGNNDSEKPGTGSREVSQPDKRATQLDNPELKKGEGDVSLAVAGVDSPELTGGLIIAHARPGETRGMCWERLRKEARAVGMPRGQGPGTAYEWATRETERLFPPPAPVVVDELPAEPEPAIAEIPEQAETETEKVSPIGDKVEPAEPGVSGLGELPDSWGELPANAQLQVEIAWVSANRLRVRSGNGVDLSRALSPAPSYSALSWLETSILFPSKFADISVKATAQQDDEREGIRREKLAIEEIRSILKEMLEG